jgi:hypothetical protein
MLSATGSTGQILPSIVNLCGVSAYLYMKMLYTSRARALTEQGYPRQSASAKDFNRTYALTIELATLRRYRPSANSGPKSPLERDAVGHAEMCLARICEALAIIR